MASLAKFSSFSFLLFMTFTSLFFTNAIAGRYFFSKTTRTDNSNNPTEGIPESGVPIERNDSTMFPSISHGSGYGLYGHGPEQFSPTNTDTIGNANSITNEKLFNGDDRREFKNQFDNMNDDPYKFSSEFAEGQNGRNYNQGNSQYQYGMSDTRFLENGRYYYDVNARGYGYGSELNPTRTNPGEHRSYRSYGEADGTVGRYGNGGYGSENRNEYHDNLNENEIPGEEHQEEYIP